MRGLSLKQPWLYAITDLGKRVENRTWLPPTHMYGKRIALHASKGKYLDEWIAAEKIHGQTIPQDIPRGAIMATAQISGWCNEDSKQGASARWWAEQEKWFFGPYGWLLGGVHVLDGPIPCKGMLGLWQVSSGFVEEINRQLVRDKMIVG